MAKTATDSTSAPLTHGAGETILEENLRDVVERSNFAVCEMTTVYLSLVTVDEFDTPSNPGMNGILFADDATPYVLYTGWFWIDPDYQAISIRGSTTVETAIDQDLEVRVDIGSRWAVLQFAHTDPGTLDDSNSILALDPVTDSGWQEFIVTLTHTDGTDPECRLNFIVIESMRIADATDLPDPTG